MSLLTSLISAGGGSLDPNKSYDGESANYSALPDATLNTNKVYFVLNDEGVNQAGFYKSNGSTWLYVGHDYNTLDDIPDGTTNKAFTQTEKTKLSTIESNAINAKNSFTQNSGQYIATEGIKARDVGGIALLNNFGTAGVSVADNGDVDIITKMTASEIKARNANGLKLHDDGGNGLFIEDGGNVGIGNTSPGEKLDVTGNATISGKLGIGKVATDTSILDMERSEPLGGGLSIRVKNTNTNTANNARSHASLVLLGNNGAVQAQYFADGFGGTVYLRSYTNHPISIGTNATERLRIENDGKVKIVDNLGIGMSPSEYAALDMEKAVTAGSGAQINLKNTASGNSYSVLNLHGNNGGILGQFFAGGGNATLRTFTNHGLIFGTNQSERMRITNGGNVGIGTTSPSQKLHVNGNAIVSGSLSKGSGSFDIPHPIPSKKKTHRLRHYFVETPSAGGNIYKYKIECTAGENLLKLPLYYDYLNKDSLVWVSPFRHYGRAYGEVMGNFVKIVTDTAGEYNVLVFGDRKDETAMKDFNKYGIEYEKKGVK